MHVLMQFTKTSDQLKSTAPQNSGRVYWRGMEHRGLWAHRYADQLPVPRRRGIRVPAAAEPDAPRCQLPCLVSTTDGYGASMADTSRDSPEKDPQDWVTGDEPMTGPQRSYLETLAREAGEDIPADLTKAQASELIERLQDKTGRRP